MCKLNLGRCLLLDNFNAFVKAFQWKLSIESELCRVNRKSFLCYLRKYFIHFKTYTYIYFSSCLSNSFWALMHSTNTYKCICRLGLTQWKINSFDFKLMIPDFSHNIRIRLTRLKKICVPTLLFLCSVVCRN